MPVTIEEVHADIAPEPDRNERADDEERPADPGREIERRLRDLLARQVRRALRLSDR